MRKAYVYNHSCPLCSAGEPGELTITFADHWVDEVTSDCIDQMHAALVSMELGGRFRWLEEEAMEAYHDEMNARDEDARERSIDAMIDRYLGK